MYRLTNISSREIALAKPSGAIILRAAESIEIADSQYHELDLRRASSLVDVERLEKDPAKPKKRPVPETNSIRIKHSGGGWWQVFVNGEEVTDGKVRKKDAERIAAEYQ